VKPTRRCPVVLGEIDCTSNATSQILGEKLALILLMLLMLTILGAFGKGVYIGPCKADHIVQRGRRYKIL
jgi:hypothetical protein